MKVQVKKLLPNAIVPTKAHITDAGYDLYSAEYVDIYSNGGPTRIKTGIAMAIPEGYVGIISDRSGLGGKGLKVHGGIIDHGYTGDISVQLSFKEGLEWCHNATGSVDSILGKTYTIRPGDKIAQIVCVPAPHFPLEVVDELPVSQRGEKGFGSSGK